MPKLLGMEPDTVQKVKPFLLIGGGGLILFLVLKGKGTPAVAAAPPTDGAPMPSGVVSPAAGGDLSQTGGIVGALQQQMQQKQLEYDAAAGNLALQGQAQQLQFQQQQQTYSLARQQSLDAQQDAVTHEQFKQLKNQGKTGGFLGSVFRNIGEGLGIYTQLQGVGIVQRPAQPTQHVSSNVTPKKPTFNPGPWGGGY